jgi:hypothetical protein
VGQGAIAPIPGSEPEFNRRNTNRDNARQDSQNFNQVLSQFRSDPAVREWRQARTATMQMRSLGQSGSAADDIALVFSFMRSVDPTSTVREGEFATAQNSTGVPDRVRNYYNQLMQGTRLNPHQRREMAATAGRMYTDRSRTYNELAQQYREQLVAMGVPSERVGRMVPIARAPITEDRRQAEQQARQAPRQGRTTQGVRFRFVNR